MKKSRWSIPITLIVLTIGLFIWKSIPKDITIKDKERRLAIENLQHENAALMRDNKKLDNQLETLKLKTAELQGIISATHDSIEQIRKRKNETIDAMHDYTHDELYEFFTRFKTKDSTD